jgi:hypothetical protein
MKTFLIFVKSNDGRMDNGYFEANDMNLAMAKAICRFSKEWNVLADEIFVTSCEENPRFQFTSK